MLRPAAQDTVQSAAHLTQRALSVKMAVWWRASKCRIPETTPAIAFRQSDMPAARTSTSSRPRPIPRRTRRAAIVVLSAGVALSVRVMYRSYNSARENFVGYPAVSISSHPEQTGIPGLSAVSLPTPSGLTLSGWYSASRNRAAVIVVHGTHSDRSSQLVESRLLASAGFGLLAFDWPGFGQSEPDGQVQWDAKERAALTAAIDWLSAQPDIDPNRIGGFGMSYGGMVMGQVAARDSRLKAVVLAAVPTELNAQMEYEYRRWWLLSSLPARRAMRDAGVTGDAPHLTALVAQIAPRPLLLLTGDRDPVVPASMTRTMYAAAKAPKEMWTIPGAGHGNFGEADPTGYGARLTRFFSTALLDGPIAAPAGAGRAPAASAPAGSLR